MKKFKVDDRVFIVSRPLGVSDGGKYVGLVGIVTRVEDELRYRVTTAGQSDTYYYLRDQLLEATPVAILAYKLGACDETKTESV